MKKFALAASMLALGVFVLPVFAAPSVDMSLEVTSAGIIQDCSGEDGLRTWEVASQITVQNTSEETVRFDSTSYFAEFVVDGHEKGRAEVSVLDSGGFEGGVQVEPGATSVFNPVVRVDLPCDARGGVLFGVLEIEGRNGSFRDADDFLEDGSAVPIGPTGIVGIAVLLGAVGLIGQLLSRKPRSIVSDRPGA